MTAAHHALIGLTPIVHENGQLWKLWKRIDPRFPGPVLLQLHPIRQVKSVETLPKNHCQREREALA